MIFAEVIGMKHGLLAAAFLLTSAGFASADYIIIVANVGGNELKTPAAGMAGMMGMRGGMAGMRGGMAGMRGGMPPGMGVAGSPPGMGPAGSPPGMGAAGSPPGMGPAGSPPGMGIRGGQAAGMGGGMMMGMRGGMAGMAGMAGGMGMAGMAGGMGMRGGMMGMMGMRGGMMGRMGGAAGSTDADDVPYFVISVVEVKPKVKNMVEHFKKVPEQLLPYSPVRVQLPDRLGKSCYLLKNPSFGEMFIISEGKDKPVPTVAQRYKAEHEKTMKGTPLARDILHLAGWALEHRLLDKFQEVMKKLVEVDKTNPAALAYLKVKAELDRPGSNDASVASWRGKLLPGYKVYETPHYLIVNNAVEAEIKTHAEHLENSFRSFYYWFALRRIALPVPRNRLVVILTKQKSDFNKLHKILTSSPVVVDGFFARRENLAVMTSMRQDETYELLHTYWNTWKDKGYDRHKLLEGTGTKPPKGAVPQSVWQEGAEATTKIAEAQMLALMLKALEQEAELATASHDASRQLLFASGLLPRNVAVPEWILFGMGSFFETPLQSPWPTLRAPSPYYLPRWRELRNKSKLEKARDAAQGRLR